MTPTSGYKRYKTDTETVATWLVATARKCGYPKNLLPNQQATSKGPRLKGKARVQERKATETAARNDLLSSSPSKPEHLIKTRDLIKLAQCIANFTKPFVKVPASFSSVLDKTIELRKIHNDWWKYQTTLLIQTTTQHLIPTKNIASSSMFSRRSGISYSQGCRRQDPQSLHIARRNPIRRLHGPLLRTGSPV